MLRYLMSVVLLASSLASGMELKPNVEDLVDFETRANKVATRSNDMIKIEHYEIPLRHLVSEVAFDRLPVAAQNALIFTKGKEKYVRWIINPEDTKWHKELEAWMKKKGISTQRHQYFDGYMTASRSYIVQDPKTEASFSLKVSTDVTGGFWRDKKQTWDDARQVKLGADHAMKQFLKRTPENFLFMDEPVVFGVKEIDQGMILRLLGDLNNKDRVYIPGFSVLHEDVGRVLAARNGSTNPAEFWKEHYIRPLGRAIAELYAATGFAYDSPHSQNFLVELDRELKPTGRIVFRDLGDSFVNVEIMKALGADHIVNIWEKSNILKGYMSIAQGVLHGNQKPSWVPESKYDEYGKVFFDEFERELSRLTKVPMEELMMAGLHRRNGDYFSKGYPVNSPGWQRFLKDLSVYGSLRPTGRACGRVFVAD